MQHRSITLITSGDKEVVVHTVSLSDEVLRELLLDIKKYILTWDSTQLVRNILMVIGNGI